MTRTSFLFAALAVFQASIALIATADLTSGRYAITMGDVQLVHGKNKDGHDVVKAAKPSNEATIWTVTVGTKKDDIMECTFQDETIKKESYIHVNHPILAINPIFMTAVPSTFELVSAPNGEKNLYCILVAGDSVMSIRTTPSEIEIGPGCSEELGFWTFTPK